MLLEWEKNTIGLTLYRLNFFTILYKNSVRTSQETHYVSAAKPNRLMLFGETVLFVVRTIRNTQIHCVGRMRSISVIKQVVLILTARI
jgi:hypothetical protein